MSAPSPLDREQAARLVQAVDEALTPTTAYRDTSLLPAIGPTPPVPQPGRPPMSQRATDISGLMLAGSVASLSVGGATSLVLYTLGQVNPVTLAIGGAAPVALVLAVGSLVRAATRGVQGISGDTHNHYNGPVEVNRSVSTETRGLFAKTINKGD
ncbi:hypothetical protein ABT264_29280 [Streptomyces virginiae]|uniref:hypothetical protein n=1 Tax=Streptomyces virginiae TaxID=1961 RepID=UPI0033343AE5